MRLLVIEPMHSKKKNYNPDRISVHHINGQKDRDKFNVELDMNKKKISVRLHEAFNLVVRDKQNPKEQLQVMVDERWLTISEETKRDLYEIINRSDRRFYKRAITKTANQLLYDNLKDGRK